MTEASKGWSQSETNALVREWMMGVGAATIGRRLGKTRNAVLGKVSRMRLPKSNSLSKAVNHRPGQAKFRADILALYNSTCAITGTSVPSVVEAAHIVPYAVSKDNSVGNGICLRADLHALFDAGLMTITPGLTVRMSPALRDRDYRIYADKTLAMSDVAKAHARFENLTWHSEELFKG